jgi:hypothetical protein
MVAKKIDQKVIRSGEKEKKTGGTVNLSAGICTIEGSIFQ